MTELFVLLLLADHPHLINKSVTTYPQVSYMGPPTNYTPISNNGRSFPPWTLNYQHSVHIVQPPLGSQRVNGGAFLLTYIFVLLFILLLFLFLNSFMVLIPTVLFGIFFKCLES